MVNDKEQAISQVIVDYILSAISQVRERLGLLPPDPHSGLGAAARDTAFWFVGEKGSERAIDEYLRQRFSEQPQNRGLIWFLGLAYGGQIWPSSAEPPEVAKDMIERIGLSEVASTPALDYLAVGSAYGSPDVTEGITEGFGYAVVVAYATDGNGMIVDRINQRRATSGAALLQISAALRSVARKFITLPSPMKRVKRCLKKRRHLATRLRVGKCDCLTAVAMPGFPDGERPPFGSRKWPTS